MKKIILFLLLLPISFLLHAQTNNKAIHLNCAFPTKLKKNQHIELIVTISNRLAVENTGTITMDLFNTATHTSVDGWFINIFPYQYFTATPRKKFTAKFPLTVPGNFSGAIKVVLKAQCKTAADSLIKIINIQ